MRPRLTYGSRDPLAGLVSPSFRRWRPRVEAAFESEAADADLAAGFSLDGEPLGIASPRAGRDGGEVRLGERSLRVRRRGERLLIGER